MYYTYFIILAGSGLDMTDFMNDEFMTALYDTFFRGSRYHCQHQMEFNFLKHSNY